MFVGDVPRAFACLGAGKSGIRPEVGIKSQPAEQVVRNASVFRSQSWQVVRLSRRTAEDQLWRVKCAPVWVSSKKKGWSARPYRLLWMCSEATGEEAFAVSNAPASIPVERLVRVAFRRGHVEHLFRIVKSELGFTHFEGRKYVALMRHLNVCAAMLAFVAEHTQRLRGEKSPGHRRAAVPGPEVLGPDPVRTRSPDGRAHLGAGDDPLPPAPQCGRDQVQTKARRSTTHTQKTEKAKNKKEEEVFGYGKVAL